MATYDLSNVSLDFNSLQSGDIINCPYTGNYKQITLPPGQYQLQCWGARGGQGYTGTGSSSTPTVDTAAAIGGDQGYSYGTLLLLNNTILYLYTGGHGQSSNSTTRGTLIPGGFNGGGNSYVRYYTTAYSSCGSGGGASDIRIGIDSLYARVIVAGGGGSDGATYLEGGAGGFDGTSATGGCGTGGYGGYMDGVFDKEYQINNKYDSVTEEEGAKAGFGFGGNGISYANGYGGAGGGGWYGGSGTYPDSSIDDDRGGGGGSNFALCQDYGKYCPNNYLLDSEYFLMDVQGGNGTNEGDGYIQITVLDCPSKYYIKNNNQWKSINSILLKENGSWKEISELLIK